MILYLIVIGGVVLLTLILIVIIIFKRKNKDENIERDSYWSEQNDWLKNEFSRCNVIVFGKKGSGKDVLFNHVIRLRNLNHYSNMAYNKLTTVMPLDCLAAGLNTYKDFLDGTIKKFNPVLKDFCDYYISDAGVYLPSQYDTKLDTRYPSMPLFYALSRQLHQMNIHANVQDLGRIWKKLREQADSYIWVRKTVNCGDYLVVHTISYECYESAERRFLPAKAKNTEVYGDIQERKFKVFKSDLDFDTYYFRKMLLNTGDFIMSEEKTEVTLKELYNIGYKCSFK